MVADESGNSTHLGSKLHEKSVFNACLCPYLMLRYCLCSYEGVRTKLGLYGEKGAKKLAK